MMMLHRVAWGFALCSVFYLPPGAAEMEWDKKMLQARGISPGTLEYLNDPSRFLPGRQWVDIGVNGEAMGSYLVEFNHQGDICIASDLARNLGLKWPGEERRCLENQTMEIVYLPQEQRVNIVAGREQRLSGVKRRGDEEGIAGLLNYNLWASENRFAGRRSRYSWLTVEGGANIESWLVRYSNQFSAQDGKASSGDARVWVERFSHALDKRVQAGKLYAQNTQFNLDEVSGIQLLSDNVANPAGLSGVLVKGFSSTDRARVEVFQNGQLIYSTLVPAGEFTLSDVDVKSYAADLRVKVTETHGQTHEFVIPSTEFMLARGQRDGEGYSLIAGKMRTWPAARARQAPMVLAFNQDIPALLWLGGEGGLLLADKYQSAALSLNSPGGSRYVFSTQLMAAEDRYNRRRGGQLAANAGYRMSDNLSIQLGLRKRTPYFTSLPEALMVNEGNHDNSNVQFNQAVSWSSPLLGNLSLSHTESTLYNSAHRYRYSSINWSRRFYRAFVSLNFAKSRGNGRQHDNLLSLNVNIPLSENVISHSYSQSGNHKRLSSQISGAMTAETDYLVGTEREFNEGSQSLQLGLNSNLHYTRLATNFSADNRHQRNYSLGATGGIAFHPQGVTFSPQAIDDTFAIVALSERLAGVQIQSPGGNSWTDWRGMAVAPRVRPWRDSELFLAEESLPAGVGAKNTSRSLRLARGGVKNIVFPLSSDFRLLLTVKLNDGNALPVGTVILDAGGVYITEVVEKGLVFLDGVSAAGELFGVLPESQKRCRFAWKTTQTPQDNMLYDKLTVTCHSIDT